MLGRRGCPLQGLLDLLAVDPYQQPPAYQAMVGDHRGAYSRRINTDGQLSAVWF